MRREAAWWGLGLAGSVAMHAVLVSLVLLAVAPDEVPPTAEPEVRLSIVSRRVERAEARAEAAGGEVVGGARPGGDPVLQGRIAMSRAGAVLPPATVLPPAEAEATAAPAAAPEPPVAPAESSGQRMAAAAPAAPRLSAAREAMDGDVVAERLPVGVPAVERPPAADVAPAVAPVPAGRVEGPVAESLGAAAAPAPRASLPSVQAASPDASTERTEAVEAGERPVSAAALRSQRLAAEAPTPDRARQTEARADAAPRVETPDAEAALPAPPPAVVEATVGAAALRSQPLAAEVPAPDPARQTEVRADAAPRVETPGAEAVPVAMPAAAVEAARAQLDDRDRARPLPAAGDPLPVREPQAQAVASRGQDLAALAGDVAEVVPGTAPVQAGRATSGAPARVVEPDLVRVAAAETAGPALSGVDADAGAEAAPAAPRTETALAPATEAVATRPASVPPPERRLVAALAWSGGADAEVDPLSLSTIAAFMPPDDNADAGAEVRDGLSQLLAGVPCARLQSTFVPETGRLVLHGHIPEESLRAPVLAALRDQIGGAIPVADRMLILPRPQCATLAAMAATGLPQSTDQSPNPRVVGAETYARIYDFAEGERLVFRVAGPDYAAYLYADYYDADGTVIHLEPNAQVPPRRIAATAPMEIGGDEAGLELRVSPPFGQEIVVVMATSAPLYDELRPVREPAAEYLAFLRERVRQARMQHPDFRGEWVYVFVRTRAG